MTRPATVLALQNMTDHRVSIIIPSSTVLARNPVALLCAPLIASPSENLCTAPSSCPSSWKADLGTWDCPNEVLFNSNLLQICPRYRNHFSPCHVSDDVILFSRCFHGYVVRRKLSVKSEVSKSSWPLLNFSFVAFDAQRCNFCTVTQ